MKRVLLVVSMVVLTGCYEWTAHPGDVHTALREVPPDNRVRVVLLNGQFETLSRPRLLGDTLMGLKSGVAWDNQVRKIPLDSLSAWREETFDSSATAKAVIVTLVSGVVLFVTAAVIALSAMGGT